MNVKFYKLNIIINIKIYISLNLRRILKNTSMYHERDTADNFRKMCRFQDIIISTKTEIKYAYTIDVLHLNNFGRFV